jgi:hypothetical protein
VQCVVTKVSTPKEAHDVAGVDNVPEKNRWLDGFQGDVAVFECS